ncbi:hypothetical protein D3C84_130630 [compost metagenome]
MAAFVVDFLEVIQVDQQHGKLCPIHFPAVDGLLKTIGKEVAVGQLREYVMGCQVRCSFVLDFSPFYRLEMPNQHKRHEDKRPGQHGKDHQRFGSQNIPKPQLTLKQQRHGL